jgi:quercetin dioxygenase-like cupin family protein
MKSMTMQPIFIPPQGGKPLNVLGEKITCMVSGEDTNGSYSIIEEISPPGGGPPPHIHYETDEIFYILEGKYEIQCGDKTNIATAGSLAVLPRGIRHIVKNVDDKPGRVLVIIMPGELVHFFEEIDVQSKENDLDPSKAMEIAKKYDVRFEQPT